MLSTSVDSANEDELAAVGGPKDHNEEVCDKKRPQFGTRILTDSDNVFKHNAWDNVVWDDEQEQAARDIVSKQLEVLVADDMTAEYERVAGSYWDAFYNQHQNRFFKDRHWLFTEFPELLNTPKSADLPSSTSCNIPPYLGSEATIRILEVGCGVGNTIFPILQATKDSTGGNNIFVYACDFSSTAIDIVKCQSEYDESRCHAFVCDITSPSQSLPFPPSSLHRIVMIFILSAIHPDKMSDCISRLATYLAPGGMLLFRDYGRYDMAQLRFKQGRCIQENFYVRGDGTRCYFFTQDEVDAMFTAAGLVKVQNLVDRRLQVNRCRRLKMYRVWVQCKYMKPFS